MATIATLLRQMDSIDARGNATNINAAGVNSLLGGLSAALQPRAAATPLVNPLAMATGPVFVPNQPSVAVSAAAATPSVSVFPHQLLELLQPTLENAMRVHNDSARIASINLRTLVDIYARQVNAAVGRAMPAGPAATLYQRLIAHRQGAPLELSDLMPAIVPGWTPPVLQPTSSSSSTGGAAAAAAAANSRKRAHGAGVTNLPDNLGLLRAGGVGLPMPQQPLQRAAAVVDPARAKAIEAIERAREKRHRTDLERHHAPTEFSPSYLKRCARTVLVVSVLNIVVFFSLSLVHPPAISEHEFVIFGLYEALKTQCGECGMRFAEADEQSRKHADWHFEINRRDKMRLERPSSRQWYAKPSDWTSNVDGVDAPLEEELLARLFETSKPLTASTAGDTKLASEATDAGDAHDGDAAASGDAVGVPSDDTRSVCPICSDKFEEFWSEGDDQWMFRGAIYDDAGRIVHQKCARAAAANNANET